MKKILLFAALLGFAVACGGNEKKEEPKAEEAQVETTATEECECEECEETATEEATAAPEVTVKQPAVNTEKAPITATDFEKKSDLTVSDKKVAAGAAQVAEKETTKAGKETLTLEAKEFEKKSNLSVGGTAAAGAVAM